MKWFSNKNINEIRDIDILFNELSKRRHWKRIPSHFLRKICDNAEGDVAKVQRFRIVSEHFDCVVTNFMPISKAANASDNLEVLVQFSITLERLGSQLAQTVPSLPEESQEQNEAMDLALFAYESSTLCNPLMLPAYLGRAFFYSFLGVTDLAIDSLCDYERAEERLLNTDDKDLCYYDLATKQNIAELRGACDQLRGELCSDSSQPSEEISPACSDTKTVSDNLVGRNKTTEAEELKELAESIDSDRSFRLTVDELPEDGTYASYHKNGEKSSEIHIKDGDIKALFYNENGQKMDEYHCKNGKFDGRWTRWYENGQKKKEGHYKNGKEEGLWTKWHENGQKSSEGHYKNGKEEGLWTKWHENGQKSSEAHFKNGEWDGLWTKWHENGQKSKEGHYKDGKAEGFGTKWDDEGNKTWPPW